MCNCFRQILLAYFVKHLKYTAREDGRRISLVKDNCTINVDTKTKENIHSLSDYVYNYANCDKTVLLRFQNLAQRHGSTGPLASCRSSLCLVKIVYGYNSCISGPLKHRNRRLFRCIYTASLMKDARKDNERKKEEKKKKKCTVCCDRCGSLCTSSTIPI